jgi:hypothetical protein
VLRIGVNGEIGEEAPAFTEAVEEVGEFVVWKWNMLNDEWWFDVYMGMWKWMGVDIVTSNWEMNGLFTSEEL